MTTSTYNTTRMLKRTHAPTKTRKEGGLRTRGHQKCERPGKPLISILTVVYNRHKFIERAIKSVLGQSYDNIEYIIVDGGSTDGTLDIIRNLGDKIDYWVSESDKGMYYALNKGIDLSNGSLIGIVHSDDFLIGNTVVERVARCFDQNDADIYHGNAISMIEYETLCTFEVRTSQHCNILQTERSIIHPTSFIARHVFNEIGMYNTQYRSASDYEFFIRCVNRKCVFHHMNFPISGICCSGNDRVSNNCHSHLEAYHFHKLHCTGRHLYYLSSYLQCIARRTLKGIISQEAVDRIKIMLKIDDKVSLKPPADSHSQSNR